MQRMRMANGKSVSIRALRGITKCYHISDMRETYIFRDVPQVPGVPPTSHPHFTGCLKCHNDDINPVK